MKKIYTLSLLLMSFLGAFAQTFYSENFGTVTANTLIPAHTGWQNPAPVVYTGTADVRVSAGSAGTYIGASGGANVFFTNTAGRYLQIEGINTSLYPTANLVLSFGQNQQNTSATASSNLTLEVSADGTNWTLVPYTRPAVSGWQLIDVPAGLIPSTANLRIRFTQTTTNIQYRIDDVKISNVSALCSLDLSDATTACDAVTENIDTYTVTIPFTGGGNATYTIVPTMGSISTTGDNPSTSASGNIIITGIQEGSGTSITVTGGDCNITVEISANACKPINALPNVENFNYQPGTLLGNYQKWREVNSGDSVIATAGNLTYPGINSSGYSVAFSGAGAEAYSPFTETGTGTIYTSFLINVTDMSNVTTDGAGTYFAGLLEGTTTSSYQSRVWFKKNGTQYNVGFSTGTTPEYSTTALNTGDTALIIIGFDYATNTHSMWLNPNLTNFSAATPATLTVTPTAPLATTFGGFILRQDTEILTPFITIDELRVATSLDALSVRSNNIAGFSMYPNPLTGNVLNLTSASNAAKTVEIYDILGKQVINKSTDNNMITVDGLTAGIYMVKITEEGKTATRKLVVK